MSKVPRVKDGESADDGDVRVQFEIARRLVRRLPCYKRTNHRFQIVLAPGAEICAIEEIYI